MFFEAWTQFDDLNMITALVSVVLGVPAITQTIRRLHDLGYSGQCVLILFIPLANIAFLIYMYFGKGNPNINEYGDIPETHNLELVDKIFIFGSLLSLVIMLLIHATISTYY
jgi:uncharacterized membrane protein YhaH (DUF805 family)